MLLKRITAFVIALASISLLVTSCASATPSSRGRTPTPVPTLVKYEPAIFTVERGPLVAEQSLSGEIVPARQNVLSFKTAGVVNRLSVQSGDRVKKGDVLAELQVDELLNQIQQARIDLEVALAALEKAKVDRQYAAEKARIDLSISKSRLDLAQLDVDNSVGVARKRAQLNLEIAQQNYKTAELNLKLIGDTTSLKEEQVVARQQLAVDRLELLLKDRQLTAPYDGIVMRAFIQSGKQVTAFTPSLEVGDPSSLMIRVQPDTKLQGQIDRDTEAWMSFSSQAKDKQAVKYLPDFVPFETATSAQDTIFNQSWMYFSIPTDISFDQLKVGTKISLNVIIGRRDNVLLLPPAAVRNYRGLNFVIVQDGDRRRRVEISKIGLQTSERWEIEGNLKEGDRIVGQ
jgi:multidrug efflux pump subunit AcrA (membrane-fusion protein)